MPKVSEAHLEARRGQILKAACRCFARSGIGETSIQDICHEAKLSVGAVYRYFRSKGQIIEAIAQLGRENTRDHFASIDTGGEPIDRLTALLSAALRFLETDAGQESTRFNVRFWSEGLHSSKIRELLVEGVPYACEPFVKSVREGQQLGIIDTGLHAESVARVLIALHMGLSVMKTLDPDVDLGRCIKVIAALISGSFVTPEQREPTSPMKQSVDTHQPGSDIGQLSARQKGAKLGDSKRRSKR
ncbi:MAG: TetR/AcrR family transcriptional regulator [Phycisphaerales bacterium]|nr:MAG: TetR/AcrR family transcriptional regulator [Phycisphaerales bacterium]